MYKNYYCLTIQLQRVFSFDDLPFNINQKNNCKILKSSCPNVLSRSVMPEAKILFLKYMEQNVRTQNFHHIRSFKSLIYTTDEQKYNEIQWLLCQLCQFIIKKNTFGVGTDTMRIKTDLRNYRKLSRYWYCMQ